MKKYLIVTALCTLGSLQSMEQKAVKREPVEWPAQLYDKGNKVQSISFCYFLKENKVSLNGKILSLGSGTGNIENTLAEKAVCVDGIDPSKNMVNFANNKYKGIPNLRFHEGFAEDFATQMQYNLAIASHSFPWFEDKPKALKQICSNLENGGEFFFTVHTSDDPKPLNLIVAEEMMSSTTLGTMLNAAIKFFSTNQSKAIGSSYPTRAELKSMSQDAGFEIITCEQQSCNVTLKDRTEVEAMQRPIIMSRPIVKYIPEMLHEYLFSQFIDLLITKLKQTDKQEYINEVTTTVVHVRKK